MDEFAKVAKSEIIIKLNIIILCNDIAERPIYSYFPLFTNGYSNIESHRNLK